MPNPKIELSQFNHKNETAGIMGPRLLGLILIAAGALVLIVPFFIVVSTEPQKIGLVGGGALIIGLIMVSIYSGTLLDFDKRRYKEYQSIFWIKLGTWQELLPIERAELVIHSYRSKNTPNGISPTLVQDITIYKCVLIANGTKFLALDFAKEKDAVAALERIKRGLEI
ncbi:hypothetical protein SAMN05444394_3179 [Algoriphagus halophilus]|uniref:Uncharacterized protein n=2 Tax=Algoriphagus halophilus TaxID=226505 RepID=A0A1N6GED8_9BACT|nr:hypothetical protein SAMN05444394_3179 [Algoriphagus halophilus]